MPVSVTDAGSFRYVQDWVTWLVSFIFLVFILGKLCTDFRAALEINLVLREDMDLAKRNENAVCGQG